MKTSTIVAVSAASIIALIGLMMWGFPIYNVWQANLAGKAELVRAEQNRQIQIQEAKALKEAAVFQAEAEVIRAGGVARSNKIIGQSLNNNEAYLRYLWVNSLGEKDDVTTIYVPTEAQMPLIRSVN